MLNWLGPLEYYESIITENPIDEIWHLLDLFASEETIAECTPPVGSSLVPFICESIDQAEEFKNSSLTGGEHTKPLLIYYCIHNLTKAVLAIETNRKPAGYHGLKKVEIPLDGNLLNVSVRLDKGVFWELLEFRGISPSKDQKITVKDLIENSGYLTREYKMAYRMESRVFFPRIDASSDLNNVKLKIDKKDTELKWKRMFPALTKYFDFENDNKDHISLVLKNGVPRGNLENIRKIMDDILVYSVYLTPPYFLIPHNQNFCWPQDAYLYALSFILGSLVRYYPEYWLKSVIANRRNRWVVRKVNSVVKRVYPNLMLNTLYGYKLYRFGSASLLNL